MVDVINNRKTCAVLSGLLFVAILLLSPFSACAESFPKPSVPKITATYFDRSYYVEPVYEIDPYSGETVKIGGGFTQNNKTIELAVYSQSFTPYTIMENDRPVSVYLSWPLRYKGHYEENWHYIGEAPYWNESYRVVYFCLGDHMVTNPHRDMDALRIGDTIDFQIKARIGYFTLTDAFDPLDPRNWGRAGGTIFHGEESAWSDIQSLTIGENGSTSVPIIGSSFTDPTPLPTATLSPSLNPTTAAQTPKATPTQPIAQLEVLGGFGCDRVVLGVFSVSIIGAGVVMVLFWRRKQTNRLS